MYWPANGEENFMKAGTKLLLRYRVLVHSGSHLDAKIAEAFDKYKSEK
jgi:uncharacterized protein with ACT and thioredoxin-like domain